MVEKKSIAVMTAGSGIGIAQTFILREYVDKTHGQIPGLEGLGGFGTYSAIVGLAAGGVATALGIISVLTKKITDNETIQLGLIGYGIPALSGGVLSGLFPAVPDLGLKAARSPSAQVSLRSAGPSGASQGTGAIPLRT